MSTPKTPSKTPLKSIGSPSIPSSNINSGKNDRLSSQNDYPNTIPVIENFELDDKERDLRKNFRSTKKIE